MRPLPSIVRFGREVCGDLAQAERREWWLANGLGSYAAGTIAGTLTRRYHGLLVAPVDPPLGRRLVFAKADATLRLGAGGTEVPLFSNRWASGAVVPRGHLNIESFRLDGRMPVWIYALGDVRIEARIWMEPGVHATCLAYRLLEGGKRANARLSVKLLVNARDHHQATRPGEFEPEIRGEANRLTVAHGDWFTLHITSFSGAIRPEHAWVEQFDLPVERERGLPDKDNHLWAGTASLTLSEGEWAGLVASLDPSVPGSIEESLRRFRARDESLVQRASTQNPELANAPEWVQQLVLAADSFLFSRTTGDRTVGESVIAGYPWFGDWGRDTMIALPGLTLATGRHDTALGILKTFARFVDRGILPNLFPAKGYFPEYNTADAALWYIEACRAYFEATADADTLKDLFPVLEDIIDWHVKGTRHGIARDQSDGLMRAGEPGVQVTWMDAKVGDWVVTPRIGKPVEVNALWCNALAAMSQLSRRMRGGKDRYQGLLDSAIRGFEKFVNRATGALYDVIDGPNGPDDSIRPNQIFAVSLPFSPIAAQVQATVLAQCGAELACSYGLRSLTPSHRDYKPYYRGGVLERDGGYHQGPVWAWLLGHYALAHLRVHRRASSAQSLLEPVRDHLMDAGLGTVSELFDGASPHVPQGAPAQAWSVACVLEAWWRLERAKRGQEAATKAESALVP